MRCCPYFFPENSFRGTGNYCFKGYSMDIDRGANSIVVNAAYSAGAKDPMVLLNLLSGHFSTTMPRK